MRIHFIRHGETDYNRLRKYYGKTDCPLNAKGIEEIKDLAKEIRDYQFDRIIVSTLMRTYQTADIIIKENGLQSMEIDDRANFNERDFGAWEALDANQIEALYPNDWHEFMKAPFKTTPLGAEAYEHFHQRVTDEFMSLLENSTPTDEYLFVGHGGVIREIIANFIETDIEYWNIEVKTGKLYSYQLY